MQATDQPLPPLGNRKGRTTIPATADGTLCHAQSRFMPQFASEPEWVLAACHSAEGVIECSFAGSSQPEAWPVSNHDGSGTGKFNLANGHRVFNTH